MLAMPAPTPFDLSFRLLGIPVRVHPFFWVLAAFLGWNDHDGASLVIWIGLVFLSILVHEFGHGLTARATTGQQPTIALYAMGGLCSYDREERSPGQRLAVLLMGPGAGFLLFGITALFSAVVLGSINVGPAEWQLNWSFHRSPLLSGQLALEAVGDLLWINLVWGVFNLLPIYPLDGGQIAHTFFAMHSRREGPRRCFILSMVTAGLLAILLYQRGQTYNALLLAYLGLINFQLLQAAHYQSQSGNQADDDDWWRR